MRLQKEIKETGGCLRPHGPTFVVRPCGTVWTVVSAPALGTPSQQWSVALQNWALVDPVTEI